MASALAFLGWLAISVPALIRKDVEPGDYILALVLIVILIACMATQGGPQ